MKSAAFACGVDDVRAGKTPAFDLYDFNDAWSYERGRLFAHIAPIGMQIKIGNKVNPKAIALYDLANERGLIP